MKPILNIEDVDKLKTDEKSPLYNEETSQFESPEQAQEYLEYVQSML